MKRKSRKIKIDLIRGGVHIWLYSAEEMSELYKDIEFNSDAKTIADEGFNPIIWISKDALKYDKPTLYGIIAHEAVHATEWLMEERGIADPEILAYGVQYITSQTIKFLDNN
jgi:hypothetical protein